MFILTSAKPLRISKLCGQKQGSPFSTHSFLLTLHLNSEKKLVCNVCGDKWMTHYYPFPSNSWILVRIGETLDIITTRSKSSRRTFCKQRGHCLSFLWKYLDHTWAGVCLFIFSLLETYCKYLHIHACFVYFWLWWAFIDACRRAGATLHCCARASHCFGFSLQSTGLRRMGFSSRSVWAL